MIEPYFRPTVLHKKLQRPRRTPSEAEFKSKFGGLQVERKSSHHESEMVDISLGDYDASDANSISIQNEFDTISDLNLQSLDPNFLSITRRVLQEKFDHLLNQKFMGSGTTGHLLWGYYEDASVRSAMTQRSKNECLIKG